MHGQIKSVSQKIYLKMIKSNPEVKDMETGKLLKAGNRAPTPEEVSDFRAKCAKENEKLMALWGMGNLGGDERCYKILLKYLKSKTLVLRMAAIRGLVSNFLHKTPLGDLLLVMDEKDIRIRLPYTCRCGQDPENY